MKQRGAGKQSLQRRGAALLLIEKVHTQRCCAPHFGTAPLAFCLCLCLCLWILTACGAQTMRPTITQDDLRSGSAVETAIEQGITDKTYAWHWRALDIEAEAARASAGLGENERHDEMVEHYRAWLAQEASLDPAVSPQEAANIAGTLFETMYGVDLSQDVLELSCGELEGPPALLQTFENGALPLIWTVWREKPGEGGLSSVNKLWCTIDAATGELVAVSYHPDAAEEKERNREVLPSCFIEMSRERKGYGRWNTGDPAFAPMTEKIGARLTAQLSKSPLTGGAAVTSMRTEVRENEDGRNHLYWHAVCDDGRTWQIILLSPYDPLYWNADEPEYPLRGVYICDERYGIE